MYTLCTIDHTILLNNMLYVRCSMHYVHQFMHYDLSFDLFFYIMDSTTTSIIGLKWVYVDEHVFPLPSYIVFPLLRYKLVHTGQRIVSILQYIMHKAQQILYWNSVKRIVHSIQSIYTMQSLRKVPLYLSHLPMQDEALVTPLIQQLINKIHYQCCIYYALSTILQEI